MVYKNITVVGSSNETKTFAVIEPLHCSLWHFVYLLIFKLKSQKNAIKKASKLKVFVAFCERKNL
jgi:flavin-binding protein dodecin